MGLSTVATLGGVTFHGWLGWVPGLQKKISTFSRIGQSGSGSEVINTRGDGVSVSAWVALDSQANAITKMAAIEALQGTAVSLSDAYGRSLSTVRVSLASAEMSAVKGTNIGASTVSTHLVKAKLTLEFIA